MNSNDKSYGGYSTHSLPTRNSEDVQSEDKKKKVKKKKEEEKKLTKDQTYVEDKVKSFKEKGKDEGEAYAIAWSILCKYKNPKSKHCKKDNPDEYFKKASREDFLIQRASRKTVKVLNELVSIGLQEVLNIVNNETEDEVVKQLVLHNWANNKVPNFILRYSGVSLAIGSIANTVHYEEKPKEILTPFQKRKSIEIMMKISKYFYTEWSSKTWAKIWVASRGVSTSDIRVEILSLKNRIKFGYEYVRILKILFP